MPTFANTQNLVEIKEIHHNTVFLKNGGMRQVLMVAGTNFALKSEEDQNLIIAAYQNFLNSIDFFLQIIIRSRKINIEKYLKKLEAFESDEPSPLLQNQNAEYREFIRGFVQKNAVMEKTFFVVVPWTPSVGTAAATAGKSLSRFLPFLKSKKVAAPASSAAPAPSKSDEDNLRRELEQLEQRVGQVADGLGVIGLEAAVLNDEQLAELFYNAYNPETIEKESASAPEFRK